MLILKKRRIETRKDFKEKRERNYSMLLQRAEWEQNPISEYCPSLTGTMRVTEGKVGYRFALNRRKNC